MPITAVRVTLSGETGVFPVNFAVKAVDKKIIKLRTPVAMTDIHGQKNIFICNVAAIGGKIKRRHNIVSILTQYAGSKFFTDQAFSLFPTGHTVLGVLIAEKPL